MAKPRDRAKHGEALTRQEERLWTLHEQHPNASYAELSEFTKIDGMGDFVSPGTVGRHMQRAKQKKGIASNLDRVTPTAYKLRQQRLLKTVKKEVLSSTFSQISIQSAEQILERLNDPEEMENVSIKDLSIVMGIAHDHHLKAENRPTQIVEIRDERQLAALGAQLVEEIRRRGLDSAMPPEPVQVEGEVVG